VVPDRAQAVAAEAQPTEGRINDIGILKNSS
jgi:hypothetical protein